MEESEKDELWLYERMGESGRVPTEKQVDFFVENVAFLAADQPKRAISEIRNHVLGLMA